MRSPAPFTNALLLAQREDLAAVDKRALREAGIRNTTILFSGAEAARQLSQPEGSIIQVVLCSEQLADMRGEEFVRLIRLHPRLRLLPVIYVESSGSRMTAEKAFAAYFSGLLIRPYTQQQLQDQCKQAVQWQQALKASQHAVKGTDLNAFLRELQTALKNQEKSDDGNIGQLYRQGMLLVRQHNWQEGISLLQQVVAQNPYHVDALVALSVAWRGKGNISKSQAILREAVAVAVENEAWDKALTLADRLMADEQSLENPLVSEVGRLVVAGQFGKAVQTAIVAQKRSSEDTILKALLRACQANKKPASAGRKLMRALAEHGEAKLLKACKAHFGDQGDIAVTDAADADLAPLPTFHAASSSTTKDTSKDMPRSQTAEPSSLQSLSLDQKGLETSPTSQPAKIVQEPGSSILDSIPGVRDVWSVVRVTAKLFKTIK